jgi:twitching motility protein PilT
MHSKIEELLKLAVVSKASDVHLVVGSLPSFRINGQLQIVSNFSISNAEDMQGLILSLLNEEQQKRFIEEKELDFSVNLDESRFRCNVYRESGQVAVAMRVIPVEPPRLEDLNLPPVLKTFLKNKQGFILVTGPTGQGKSTTVAAMINEINQDRNCHIVTIEDPMEYVIKPVKALITQRELGADTKSFEKALRSVLRQDPNVVFVGEMRDLETIQLALTVAETGHLVFSTLHTNSSAQSIDRIIDVFPEGSKTQIRTQLASVLTVVISQRLVPTKGGDRIPAVEVLVANSAVRNMIREQKTFMVDNAIQTGADLGMMSMEMSLAKLVKSGQIDETVAMEFALRPLELQSNLRMVKMAKNG